MNGSIQKRGKHSWRLTIDLGKDTEGKRKRRFITFRGTKGEAQQRLRELLTQVDQGISIDPAKQPLDQFLDDWISKYGEVSLSPHTLQGYNSI